VSQVSYASEKVAKKKVLLYNGTGADIVLRQGWAVCYDHSQTDITQAYRVVRPATLNLSYFAGVITEEYDGFGIASGASRAIEIYVPTKYGQVVTAWVSGDMTAVQLLEVIDGSFPLVIGATTKVCKTVQSVDRTTPGPALVRLYGISDPLA